MKTTFAKRLPAPGQILIPRKYCYALKIFKYWENSNSCYCYRCDLKKDRTPGKQTGFGDDYFVFDIVFVKKGVVRQLNGTSGDKPLLYDIYGTGQMNLF